MCLPFVVVFVVGKLENRYFMENIFLAREIVVFPPENCYAEKSRQFMKQKSNVTNLQVKFVRKLRIFPNHS